jgi:hypothetical protein
MLRHRHRVRRIHNRIRDWHDGTHPGYALACWLQQYKEQVFLFTRDFGVGWTTLEGSPGRRRPPPAETKSRHP